MAQPIDIRAPYAAVFGSPEAAACRDCLPGASPPLVSAWRRDPAGRPVRRWSLAAHTHQ